MNTLDQLLSFIAPHHCLECKSENSFCCQKCLENITSINTRKICYLCQAKAISKKKIVNGICHLCLPKQSLNGVFWYADYKNELASKLVKSLKFSQIYDAKRVMSSGISNQYQSLHLPVQSPLVSAIPTANKRVRSRGWDQAKLIAKDFARKQKLPYKSLLLRTSSFDQIGATKIERQAASNKFFKLIRKALIRNKTIILIDDVVTTGSSLNSAAKLLKSAGAKEVYGFTFARQGLKKDKKSKPD